MSGERVDVYELLKMNAHNPSPHLVKILKQLGYNDLYTLDQIESPDSLQETIREIHGYSDDYNSMTEEQKRSLLGPMCWKTPACFKFMPGERASIAAIKSTCNKLLQKQALVYMSHNLDSPHVITKDTPKVAKFGSKHGGF